MLETSAHSNPLVGIDRMDGLLAAHHQESDAQRIYSAARTAEGPLEANTHLEREKLLERCAHINPSVGFAGLNDFRAANDQKIRSSDSPLI